MKKIALSPDTTYHDTDKTQMRFVVLTTALSFRLVRGFVVQSRILKPTLLRLSYQSRKMATDEVTAAKAAAATHADGGAPTVFDKILSGEWSSNKVYEDDLCLAFRDISPQAPVHVMVIPKNRDGLTQLKNAREDQKDILGHLLYVAKTVGAKECPDGFRIVINDGEHGAQSVYHLHLHVVGGRQMQWPPG